MIASRTRATRLGDLRGVVDSDAIVAAIVLRTRFAPLAHWRVSALAQRRMVARPRTREGERL
jgi:hypothetical protein